DSNDCKTDDFKIQPGSTTGGLAGALSATKDATPGFTRSYAWHITKDVDKTLVKKVGGTATFNYTATVTRSAGTDSAFKITGTIVVVNDLAAGNANNVTVTDTPIFNQLGPTA